MNELLITLGIGALIFIVIIKTFLRLKRRIDYLDRITEAILQTAQEDTLKIQIQQEINKRTLEALSKGQETNSKIALRNIKETLHSVRAEYYTQFEEEMQEAIRLIETHCIDFIKERTGKKK